MELSNELSIYFINGISIFISSLILLKILYKSIYLFDDKNKLSKEE